ncbi:hypothetical protein ACMAZD_00535 [Vibrio sp. nBUS_14]|uniref:hypothetical protein n=1 Tax=Vibrio sp. nBUS_14 TaxID=3395321 RepID=UPI003EBC2B66
MNQKLVSGLKSTERLLLKWGATHEQIQVILPTEEDSLEVRISNLLSIHAILRAIFSDEDNVYGFMSHTNNNTSSSGEAQLVSSLQDAYLIYKQSEMKLIT